MTTTELIGYIAAFCTTVSFVPQVFQVWRTRSVQDISLGMYLVLVTGIALWLAYGLIISDWPIMLANSITLLLSGSVLVMKLYYRRPASRRV